MLISKRFTAAVTVDLDYIRYNAVVSVVIGGRSIAWFISSWVSLIRMFLVLLSIVFAAVFVVCLVFFLVLCLFLYLFLCFAAYRVAVAGFLKATTVKTALTQINTKRSVVTFVVVFVNWNIYVVFGLLFNYTRWLVTSFFTFYYYYFLLYNIINLVHDSGLFFPTPDLFPRRLFWEIPQTLVDAEIKASAWPSMNAVRLFGYVDIYFVVW